MFKKISVSNTEDPEPLLWDEQTEGRWALQSNRKPLFRLITATLMKGIPRAPGKQHVWRKGHWTRKKRILLGHRSALWPLNHARSQFIWETTLTQVIHHNDLCLTQVTEMCPANCETKCVYLNLITFTEKFRFKRQTLKKKKIKSTRSQTNPKYPFFTRLDMSFCSKLLI